MIIIFFLNKYFLKYLYNTYIVLVINDSKEFDCNPSKVDCQGLDRSILISISDIPALIVEYS